MKHRCTGGRCNGCGYSYINTISELEDKLGRAKEIMTKAIVDRAVKGDCKKAEVLMREFIS